MNRSLVLGIGVFLATMSLTLIGGEQESLARRGCNGCNGRHHHRHHGCCGQSACCGQPACCNTGCSTGCSTGCNTGCNACGAGSVAPAPDSGSPSDAAPAPSASKAVPTRPAV